MQFPERVRQRLRPKEFISQRDVSILIPLKTEIEQCLVYFEGIQNDARERLMKDLDEAVERGERIPTIPEILKEPIRLRSIHGRKYTVGRLGKGYFWEETGDNVRHTVGKEAIPGDIIHEVQNVTFPYAAYIKSRKTMQG
jgi:hypothetical protein